MNSVFVLFRYTLNEVVAMIEDDQAAMSADIFITQQSDDEVSAKDSDNDDQPTNINHLSRAQLSAETEQNLEWAALLSWT